MALPAGRRVLWEAAFHSWNGIAAGFVNPRYEAGELRVRQRAKSSFRLEMFKVA
jgi:hypothetical protein